MKTFSRMMLLLLTVCECGSSPVVGYEGQSITLSCRYDINHHNPRPICWGRGAVPLSGCKNQLISTDGYKVQERVSSRYQLLGQLNEGDVSLTILSVTDSDAGRYGCRVDVYGWFNDEKHHTDLIIKKALPSSTTAVQTTGGGSDVMENRSTVSTVTTQNEQQQVNSLPVVIGCAAKAFFITFMLVTLLTAAYVSKKQQSATVLRANSRPETCRRLNQTVEEEDSPV